MLTLTGAVLAQRLAADGNHLAACCAAAPQNLRSLAQPQTPALLSGGFRTDHEWKKEVDEAKQRGEYRGQLSSRLREQNVQLQAAADLQIEQGVGRVEAALQSKLAKTHALANGLEQVLAAVNSELGGLARSQQRLSAMVLHLQQKAAVNTARQQARSDRPAREHTCDDVNRSLARQQALLANLIERLQRGLVLVANDAEKLSNNKQLLLKDLKDKQAAMGVDEAVLHVQSGDTTAAATQAGVMGSAALARAAAIGAARVGGTHSHTWAKKTESLLAEAQQLTADSGRLRKAVRALLQEAQGSSHAAAQQLEQSMATKRHSTQVLRDELKQQLSKVEEEKARQAAQQESLRKSLQDKQYCLTGNVLCCADLLSDRSPLQQLLMRSNLRSTRPDAEVVDDEVQCAMVAEAAALAAVSAQLCARADAARQQVVTLDELSAALLSKICDKEAAMSLEEKVALLDGRALPAVPPTPSVLSVCSSVASGYSRLGESASQVCSRASTPPPGGRARAAQARPGTAGNSAAGGSTVSVSSSARARISALEQELAAAKVARQELEATVRQLKLQEQHQCTEKAAAK